MPRKPVQSKSSPAKDGKFVFGSSANPRTAVLTDSDRERLTKQLNDIEERPFYTLGNVSDGVWYSMHLLAADGKRAAVEDLLETLSRRFVCPKCIMHLKEYISKNPRPRESGKELFYWTIAFHNSVNKRINGKIMTREGADILLAELTLKADKALEKSIGGDLKACKGCDKGKENYGESRRLGAVSFVR